MNKLLLQILIFLIGLLVFIPCKAQFILNGNGGFRGLIFNYSTRDDVVKAMGNDYTFSLNSYIAPDFEASDVTHYSKASQMIYKSLGISFICDEDGEIINSAVLTEPFSGYTSKGFKIEVGKTTFKDILNYKDEDSLNISTSNASIYWFFSIDSVYGYVLKDTIGRYKHRNDLGWGNALNDQRSFVERQKIKYIIVPWNHKNRYSSIRNGKCKCETPRYAPDSVTHLNCSYYKKEKLIDWFIYGDMMAPPKREGLWKTFHTNHVIASEGKYKNDKKVGLFKFYDDKGRLVKTINFDERNILTMPVLLFILLTFIGIVILIRIIFFKKPIDPKCAR